MDEKSNTNYSIFPIDAQGIYELTNIRPLVPFCLVLNARKEPATSGHWRSGCLKRGEKEKEQYMCILTTSIAHTFGF